MRKDEEQALMEEARRNEASKRGMIGDTSPLKADQKPKRSDQQQN